MPTPKLSFAASLCTTNNMPHKWARNINTTATTTTTNNNPCLSPYSKVKGWRLTPCAPPSLAAHDKPFFPPSIYNANNYYININYIKNRKDIYYGPNSNSNHYINNKKLGFVNFRGHKCFSANSGGIAGSSDCSPPSSSSPHPPLVSGLESDMGSGNANSGNGGVWYHNDHNSLRQNQSSSTSPSSSKILTLPTILTLGRVAAVPLLISFFYVDSWWGRTATTSIFIAAAITDWLDGYIARKMRLGSAFGAFLDPVADKLMVAATLVLLCSRPLEVAMFGQVPWLMTVPAVAIIGREITMSAVREWAASQNGKLLEAVAVNNLGKWKTATQMFALTILLATRDSSLAGPGFLVASGVALLYISAGLSLWSLAVYMGKIRKVLLK
ncbi:CDP-OH_P_transf domain-containing protein [Cephalotus follicularis]|uniref:CDP-diacylglycerol--glycerol-3-phosphate 1-phosphatidyltransferase n=1 Tax=Cephalotus follicularis TaxID=3775 RepID=A0A1Q3B6S7_CEPFO|nr:CDP-OH_P_transf domain-containing protein [Cephalotus follicularis]